jgi:hypothetical protein
VPDDAAFLDDVNEFLLPDALATGADLVVDPRREATFVADIDFPAIRTLMIMCFHFVLTSGTCGQAVIVFNG